MNGPEKIEIQRDLLNDFKKQIIKRIKEVQQEAKDACTQEDAWCKSAVEHELIDLKIKIEKWRKKLKQ